MLEFLWHRKIGAGVIDCDFDSSTKQVLAGDVSGAAVCLSYDNNLIWEHSYPMPIWGTSIVVKDGTPHFALALATKVPASGKLIVATASSELFSHDFREAAWDTTFLQAGTCVATTTWEGRLALFKLPGGELEFESNVKASLFGIAQTGSDLFIAASGVGVLKHTLGSNLVAVAVEDPEVCYNICCSQNLLLTGATESNLQILRVASREVAKINKHGAHICSVAVHKGFCYTGDFDGNLIVSPLNSPEIVLHQERLPDTIWNISIDGDSERMFVACGDGTILCFQVSPISADDVLGFDISNASSSDVVQNISGANRFPYFIFDLKWRQLAQNKELIAKAAKLIPDQPEKSIWDEDRYFWQGMLALQNNEPSHAVRFLQKVSAKSIYYPQAVKHISRALSKLGMTTAALKILLDVAPSLEGHDYLEINELLGDLFLESGFADRARIFYELVAAVDITFGDIRAKIDRMRQSDPFTQEIVPLPPQLSGLLDVTSSQLAQLNTPKTKGDLSYNIVSYVKYEYASRADEVKKLLEIGRVERALVSIAAPEGERRSLDIGCATGRYPLWFASRGFEATGYDVAEEAIKICRERAEQSPFSSRLKFDIREIPYDEILHDDFSVITCMMGTFNHIRKEAHEKVISQCLKALRRGGLLIISGWNPACPYPGLLDFYVREEKEEILRNSLDGQAMTDLLKNGGFANLHIEYSAYLTDECYNAWANNLTQKQLIELDGDMARLIPANNAQMLISFSWKG